MSGTPTKAQKKAFIRRLHERHPGFRIAVTEDVRVTCMHRGEHYEGGSGLRTAWQAVRLAWVSDAFFAQLCYRLRARLMARGIPVLPRLLHRVSMVTAQVSIGDPVLLRPGIYIVHGQVVLDGLVEVGSGTVISPWVTIGLVAGNHKGPSLGEDVFVGTGAKVLGDLVVGRGAIIGAGAVITRDVEVGSTVTGVPGRAR